MSNTHVLNEIREALDQGNLSDLDQIWNQYHPVAIAEVLSEYPPDTIWTTLRQMQSDTKVEVFCNLEEECQEELLLSLSRVEAAKILSDMPPDDRVDLYRRMPEDRREDIIPAMAQAEREDIRRLIAYEEGTAGSVMTSDYATLMPDLTAAKALDHLRFEAPNTETIYYSYVIDEKRRLLGYVSLKDLILAPPWKPVREIMHQDTIFARVQDDQESAARSIQKYDLIALPVVNGGEALVGIITHDDAIDIIVQEQTEDMEKMMAITGDHGASSYLKMSSWEHFKNRSIWIVALAALGLVSGYIVQNFEGLLLQFAILATFMPMLADTGGNTGSQSASLVIRALALKEIAPRDILRVLWKELMVSMPLGLLLACLAFGRVFLFANSSHIPQGFSLERIGFAIGLALCLQVVTSTLAGALLPMGAAKCKLDPAVVASPALTTVVDITGLLIFFTTTKLIIGI